MTFPRLFFSVFLLGFLAASDSNAMNEEAIRLTRRKVRRLRNLDKSATLLRRAPRFIRRLQQIRNPSESGAHVLDIMQRIGYFHQNSQNPTPSDVMEELIGPNFAGIPDDDDNVIGLQLWLQKRNPDEPYPRPYHRVIEFYQAGPGRFAAICAESFFPQE